MRQVMLSEGAVGLAVGRSICAADGTLLAQAGVVLTESLVEALRARGFGRVIVQDATFGDVVLEDAIGEDTRALASSAVWSAVSRVCSGGLPDVESLVAAVDRIIEDVTAKAGAVLSLFKVTSLQESVVGHCVDVAVVSISLAASCGYGGAGLREVGLGALLHDIGKARVPQEALNAPRPLTPEEFERVKLHTVLGHRVLSRCGKAARVALEHHEMLDGRGYPRGLRGHRIGEASRLVAVADVFCAMTEDRPYRKSMPPHVVIAHLERATDKFDRRFVSLLAARWASYPEGTLLRLSTGEVGVVVRQDGRDSRRPVVRVLVDAKGRPVEQRELALADRDGVRVEEVLEDVPVTVRSMVEPGAGARLEPERVA